MLLALLVAIPSPSNAKRQPNNGASSAAVGDSSSPQAIVEAKLLVPLQNKDAKRPKFSRAAPPPAARRVRILDGGPQADAKGQSFVAFVIDEAHSFSSAGQEIPEESWRKEAFVGCVYPQKGEVFVKMGETSYPASVLWGSSESAAPAEVCKGV